MIDELLADPPLLHGEVTHGLVDDTLRWLGGLPRPLRRSRPAAG